MRIPLTLFGSLSERGVKFVGDFVEGGCGYSLVIVINEVDLNVPCARRQFSRLLGFWTNGISVRAGREYKIESNRRTRSSAQSQYGLCALSGRIHQHFPLPVMRIAN